MAELTNNNIKNLQLIAAEIKKDSLSEKTEGLSFAFMMNVLSLILFLNAFFDAVLFNNRNSGFGYYFKVG